MGLGMTIQSKPQPRLLFGGGIAYGEKNKIILTIGGILGSVQRLSAVYFAPDLSKILYAVPETSVTKSVLSISGFLSISYNFINL